MTPPSLDLARSVLDGRTAAPPGCQARIAAFLARQALQDEVDALCAAHDPALRHPVTMRSRLTVLRFIHGADVARTAEVAWQGLNEACHHHAYELSPTAAEIGHLIDVVASLPSS
jgi:hypothetical protein